MKNVLILSCSTGQGHNSCALAVKEFLAENRRACEIRDVLDFISPSVSRMVSNWHSRIYRYMPGLFRWGYQFSEAHPAVFKANSVIYKALTAGSEQMHQFIADSRYDTVICTHVFSALILTHMLRLHPMHIRTVFIATDYTSSPSLEVSDLQYYMIPDESLKDEFIKCGIPKERIVAAGIPVRREFWRYTDKADAKRLLGVDANHTHLLIACGSIGCGPIKNLVRQIAKQITPDMEVSVICGTNQRLYRKLKRKYAKEQLVHILGYTKQMSLYLDSADLYLTKPGGISVTEAAIKKLPMVFVNAVAGCEAHNMRFFMEKGAAITAASPRELADSCIRILRSHTEQAEMVRALCAYCQSLEAAGTWDSFCKKMRS